MDKPDAVRQLLADAGPRVPLSPARGMAEQWLQRLLVHGEGKEG
jgi:hypothetical protein